MVSLERIVLGNDHGIGADQSIVLGNKLDVPKLKLFESALGVSERSDERGVVRDGACRGRDWRRRRRRRAGQSVLGANGLANKRLLITERHSLECIVSGGELGDFVFEGTDADSKLGLFGER